MIEALLKTQVGRLIRKIVPKDKKGAILLEFAFSIPILITCLYYATDVPQAFRMSNKTQWMCELYAQSAINLLNFKEDKRLKVNDLKGLSKLIACCITGSPANADLKGLKIEIEVAGSIQDTQFEKSAEGEYIVDRITGEYKKFSELGYFTQIDESDHSNVWVNYQDNLYGTVRHVSINSKGEVVSEQYVCTLGSIGSDYYWHENGGGRWLYNCKHEVSNDPGGEVRWMYHKHGKVYSPHLFLARTRYALPTTKKCEISTDKDKINVDIKEISKDTAVPPGKLMISTSIKSDKLFYMLPIKTIGTKEDITISLPM